jgi:hypothetical protein
MAWADVARAKAKATAINLIIAFLPCEPSRTDFLGEDINSAIADSVQHDALPYHRMKWS